MYANGIQSEPMAAAVPPKIIPPIFFKENYKKYHRWRRQCHGASEPKSPIPSHSRISGAVCRTHVQRPGHALIVAERRPS